MDTLHWAQHVHPSSTPENWPVGKVSSHVAVERAMREMHSTETNAATTDTVRASRVFGPFPPSTTQRLHELQKLVDSDMWRTSLPYVRCIEDVKSSATLWESALKHIDHDQPAKCASVQVSTSVHEDAQLEYGRKDVPLCSMGNECAALLYPGNQGPLPIYMLPSTQAAFDAGDKSVATSNPRATCLLCLRRDAHGACLAWHAMVPNAAAMVNRSALLPAPFCNLVNVPGGYKESVIAMDSAAVFSNSAIVGVSGELRVKYNAEKQIFAFCQHALKVNPPSFLFQGTTTISK